MAEGEDERQITGLKKICIATGRLDQLPFLFASAKNIEHLVVCCVGASAQSHNCSVNDGCKLLAWALFQARADAPSQ